MKRKWILWLVVGFLLMVPVKGCQSQQQEVSAEAEGFCNVVIEVDHQVQVTGEDGQILNLSYGWQDTECPVLKVENFQSTTVMYRLRFASNNIRYFYWQNEHNHYLGIYPQPVEHVLYVPDADVSTWTLLGYDPIPFSQITDWDDPDLLGMSPADTVAQWFVHFDFDSTDPEYRPWFLVEETPYQPSPTWSMYLTWRRQYKKVFMPMLVNN